jgi:hypothetical protein
MAFLDNSGDIILDAVLTDYGRAKLASGSAGGTFVSSFAFFDDEINYGLYDYTHPSGSAYYDLEIVQTPILEAFTNNASSAKYPLYASGLSSNLFYLPVLELNSLTASTGFSATSTATSADSGGTIIGGIGLISGSILLAADSNTTGSLSSTIPYLTYGGGSNSSTTFPVRVDIGIDNASAPNGSISELRTGTAIIYYDSRFLRIHGTTGVNSYTPNSTALSADNVDDDGIASVRIYTSTSADSSATSANKTVYPKPYEYRVVGSTPIASVSNFDCAILLKLDVTTDIKTSDYYFDLLGFTDTTTGTASLKAILTNIQVVSADTGASINIPIRILKA